MRHFEQIIADLKDLQTALQDQTAIEKVARLERDNVKLRLREERAVAHLVKTGYSSPDKVREWLDNDENWKPS